MKRELLESYKSKKEEIRELEYKLEHVKDNDAGVGVSVINDYRSGYPHPQTVVGYDYELIEKRMANYRSRIAKLKAECAEVEEFIEAIEDSLMRRIFRMYYVDGLTQKEIGKRVHMERSNVSIRINKFLDDLEQVSHNSHDSHV